MNGRQGGVEEIMKNEASKLGRDRCEKFRGFCNRRNVAAAMF